ncbi:DUF3365 domain-containing protein [Shewanella inventionis]|uniref:Tll0287-like domain-containing protein n=1 Tax=Shewanella inventionis TaxID=1738770 RepID=A0ABQ1IV51_9GAMM|nr:DUF3365 domain-containing protein [Shewanella inventionis]MCL1158321.1 DUF3365 domain-containing protein [Shewanella inventionis]UAL41855.1 DUF3365 domain-containing protein [Shewanella inventionis]GGB51810.1 hypothetical protein GCM10011607_10340 [Shewanella inventionis]
MKNINCSQVKLMTLSTVTLLASLSSTVNAESFTEQQQLEQQANQKIAEFSQALKGQLQAAIKQGGLPAGVSVCQSVAPSIAAQNSTDGWVLKRTSLRVRNSNNSPDAWELAQLNQFEQIKAASVPQTQTPIVSSEYVAKGDTTTFRYMKAIPTQELCLGCHGSNITPELSTLIKQAYPDDKAINFELGDIRGAFSLQKVIGTQEHSITAKP